MTEIDSAKSPAWPHFLKTLVIAALVSGAGLIAFVAAFDPYGVVRRSDHPVMVDQNQRLMYPQIVRSRRFDSAVVGTSTIRLLDPARLDALFGGRFANLAMNAATPWEQSRMAALVLRENPAPKALVWGIDLPGWCAPEAAEPARRITFRGFPDWLFDPIGWQAWSHLFNLRTLEFAAKLFVTRLGIIKPRIRDDGYDVFVPPEWRYDLERARYHIRRGLPAQDESQPEEPPAPRITTKPLNEAAPQRPALAWLEETVQRLPAGTNLIIGFMPVHTAVQPAPGSAAARDEAQCKSEIAAIAAEANGVVVDFRIPSDVTREDSNYWDPLHYRVGIAERIAQALKTARADGRDDPAGFFKIVPAPRHTGS